MSDEDKNPVNGAKKKPTYDFTKLVNNVKETFKKNKSSNLEKRIGLGSDLKVFKEEDFIKLGEWWSKPTGVYGLPFGEITFIAGDSDSGKTSFCIQSMKACQEQNVGIIYTESEGKTNKKDLDNWGVDSDQVILVKSRIAEEAFELTNRSIDEFRALYPDAPLLVIIDSLGNMLSLRDSEMDLLVDSSKPGGRGSINRLGLNGLILRMQEDAKMAVLLISYTYDNIGSVGKTNAGGKALHLFSSLIYQTSRKGWLEKTEAGQKKRIGAEVVWRLYKNHVNKDAPGLKEIVYKINDTGMHFCEEKSEG